MQRGHLLQKSAVLNALLLITLRLTNLVLLITNSSFREKEEINKI